MDEKCTSVSTLSSLRIGTHGGVVKCHGVTNLVSWCPPGVTLLWSPPGVTLQTNWLKSRVASSLHSHVSQIVQFVIHLNCSSPVPFHSTLLRNFCLRVRHKYTYA